MRFAAEAEDVSAGAEVADLPAIQQPATLRQGKRLERQPAKTAVRTDQEVAKPVCRWPERSEKRLLERETGSHDRRTALFPFCDDLAPEVLDQAVQGSRFAQIA